MTRISAIAGCMLAVLMVAGCSKSGDTKPASQVAVKVNDSEISVHQVNALLTRVKGAGVSSEQQAQIKRRVVGDLIDQQLLIEQSLASKLDRDPEVLAALEASRRQILSQAYIQKRIAASARPSEEDVKQYFEANPALFSDRKAYMLQELATDFPVERVDELNVQVKEAKSLADIGNWLQAGGHQVAARSAVRAAEQLPLASLPRIAAMRNGEIAAFVNDNRVTILQVVDSKSQPLSAKDATPFIEQYLTTTKRDELLQAELKQLRQTAKIQYVGAFADASDASTGNATAPVPAAGKAGSELAEAQKAPSASGDAAIEKGVRGLR